MARKKSTRYTAKKLHRRNIRFWIFYLVLLVLIGFGFRAVYIYFDDCLTAYEAANPDIVIEQTASLFTERRFDELYAYETNGLGDLETKEDYVAYLNALTENTEIAYREVTSPDPDHVRSFVVTADGKSFASFTLRKTGNAAEFDIIPLLGYKLSTEEFAVDSISSSVLQPAAYEVTVRDTDTVLVNGQALDASHIVKSGVTLFYSDHMPAGAKAPTLTTYRFSCALGEPTIVAQDENGVPYALSTADGYRHTYEIQYCDDEMKSVFDGPALECVKNIARYTTKNQTQTNVTNAMLKNSAAINKVRNMDGTWLTQADKYSFANAKVEHYVRLSETAFCCEVSVTYNTRSKGKDNSYPIAYRLYYTRSGSDWLVYDFENI